MVIAPVVVSGGDSLQTVEERIIIQAAQIFTDILKKNDLLIQNLRRLA